MTTTGQAEQQGGARGPGGPLRAPPDRGDRLRRRLVPAAVLAALAFTAGVVVGAGSGDDGEAAATAYAKAWAAGDWAAMHAQLTAEDRRRLALIPFAEAGRRTLATATANERAVRTGTPERDGETWRVPVTVRTRAFGTVRGTVVLAVREDGDATRVAYDPSILFPGLKPGEQLTRQTAMPARGALLARDGTPLAQGPERSSPVPELAAQLVGRVEPAADADAERLLALGAPPGASVGTTGLERVFDAALGGVPSGQLRAGGRVIARGAGKPGADVRTTIDPGVERAAISALAGRYGAAIAIDPQTGGVLAMAGQPLSLLQPPGSTFKIITTAGALEEGIATPRSTYPFEGAAMLSGVPLANAGGEIGGGTLVQAFAESCNSVFAPLGAELGAERLVAYAERFGFNRPPAFATAATSTIPQAGEIGDDLAVGSTAIGQGQVQATALQMAEAAGVMAGDGRRRPLSFSLAESRRARPKAGERVVSAQTARRLERMMLEVVRTGTGTAAAIAGVPVAGKTGTAELKSREPGDTSTNPEDTTAWFVAYAPAGTGKRPRALVAVMFPGAGAGGETAAPAAREILAAALQR
ncbi:MAG: penicillin-binding transpeptidase domain-containing protein [Solirubrobacteraceae bacterium]|nr:penicillin-binding transpeptidase domain-containing protein [Solirubrobacteraceae bacterium]